MLYQSALMTSASGSLNGITASHNRGGRYFRARTIPTDPATPYQETMRAGLLALSQMWSNSLSPTQRSNWIGYANDTPVVNALGEMITLTGQQMFIRCNTPRYQAKNFVRPGGASYTPPSAVTFLLAQDAPLSPGLENVGFVTFSNGAEGTGTRATAAGNGSIDVGWDEGSSNNWFDAPEACLLVYMSRPVIAAKTYFRGPYAYAGFVQGDDVTAPTSPATIPLPFAGSAGEIIKCRVTVTGADGKLSAEFFGQATLA